MPNSPARRPVTRLPMMIKAASRMSSPAGALRILPAIMLETMPGSEG
jgi:hypothetical protein